MDKWLTLKNQNWILPTCDSFLLIVSQRTTWMSMGQPPPNSDTGWDLKVRWNCYLIFGIWWYHFVWNEYTVYNYWHNIEVTTTYSRSVIKACQSTLGHRRLCHMIEVERTLALWQSMVLPLPTFLCRLLHRIVRCTGFWPRDKVHNGPKFYLFYQICITSYLFSLPNLSRIRVS